MPPKPNALTPARRASPGHGRARLDSVNGDSGVHPGFGRSMLSVGGSTRRCSASAALTRPATPAVHLVCPICDLIDPSAMLPAAAPAPPKKPLSVSSSVRSPTTVPVPCASTSPTEDGGTPALRYARASVRCCPCARGAVRPRLLPSLPPPTALITA